MTHKSSISPSKDTPTKAASLGEHVYLEVLKAIREGKYHPGERIRESEITQELNVSRTPVREAFRRLQSEGRLTIEPQRGAVVTELNHQEVAELYELRQQLESIAAQFAAKSASDAEISTMEYLLKRAEESADDHRALNQINWELHHTIYQSAHNRFLMKVYNSLSDSMALLRGSKYIPEGRPETLHKEHKKIVDAIKKRDPEGAATAAKEHIQRSFELHLETKLNL
ncbi:MAG: GntR family transcriptional regulator [Aliivibrio sp.]|uniref:GntR family transcriptional regulator n=1 Tax=Aliivibrio sp. TaxID=1872443 RepID=UPI001A4B147B|nr:GntR family transcriptional regulator [Aliivibrio sp.]